MPYSPPEKRDPHACATDGEWIVEKKKHGACWVLGPDPQDGDLVLVAACEMEDDAQHIADLHNRHARRGEKNA